MMAALMKIRVFRVNSSWIVLLIGRVPFVQYLTGSIPTGVDILSPVCRLEIFSG
jgi:hypothetical protein